MAQGKRIDTDTAANVLALKDSGFTRRDIANATGVGERTVNHIVNGAHGWGELLSNDPRFAQYRREMKRTLQAGSLELAKKALGQLESKLSLASAAQAAVIYGVLRDKERLDAGEPNELHAITVQTREQALATDALAEALRRRLVKPTATTETLRPPLEANRLMDLG